MGVVIGDTHTKNLWNTHQAQRSDSDSEWPGIMSDTAEPIAYHAYSRKPFGLD